MGRNSTKSANRPVATANSFLNTNKVDKIFSDLFFTDNPENIKTPVLSDELTEPMKKFFRDRFFDYYNYNQITINNLIYFNKYLPEKTKKAVADMVLKPFLLNNKINTQFDIFKEYAYTKTGESAFTKKESYDFIIKNVEEKYPTAKLFYLKFDKDGNKPIFNLTKEGKKSKYTPVEIFKNAVEEIEKNGDYISFAFNFKEKYYKEHNIVGERAYNWSWMD